MDLAGVRQAVVFAVPNPTLGEDLAAAVVISPESGLTESAIRAFAFEHLADYKVPSQVLIVDAIPKRILLIIATVKFDPKFVWPLH